MTQVTLLGQVLGSTGLEWASMIASCITASVAVVACCVAGWHLHEVRQTRLDQSRPFVVVDIQPSEVGAPFLELVVENTGTTSATDVGMTFQPPIRQSETAGDSLRRSILITEGIKMLPPGRRITALFDVGPALYKNPELPRRYEVKVSLKDARGRPLPEQRYTIDLRYLESLMSVRVRGIHDVAEAIRELHVMVRKVTGTDGRVKVSVREDSPVSPDRT